MELISPIIYKKLDFQKFDKTSQTSQNSNVLYDKFSKNLIQFGDENIKILNKRTTSLKKNLNIKLSKEKITKVAVDKHIRYMIVLVDNKMSLIINLRTEKVCEILHYDFSLLLGVFFLQISGNANVHAQLNDDLNFVMVFSDKLVFFKILNGSQTEKVFEFKTLKFGSNLVMDFHFNLRYSILVLERKENNFDFYNLSVEKYYAKAHPFNYPIKNTKKDEGKSSISKLFGIFRSSSSKKMNENVLLDGYQQKEVLYKKNHFFLEILYKKLYFICMNYNESEIQIFHVENLISIKKSRTILFENSQISTLQFIDNLLLLHNFERCDTIVIDLKSENADKVIFKNFPMTNFDILHKNSELNSEIIQPKIEYAEDGNVKCQLDYNFVETISMLSYNNRIFYEKNLIINGSVIFDRDDNQHYVCYFDPMIYYENVNLKYEAVVNLIRRKNSKDVIIHALYEMIRGNHSVKVIKFIFNKIVKQIHKNLDDNKNLVGVKFQRHHTTSNINNNVSRMLTNSNESEQKKNSYDLLNPKHFILLRKRSIIKQPDLYYNLFKPFEHKPNVDYEYVFKLLVHFVNSLISFGIPIQPSFQCVLVNFLRKIKNVSFLGIYLQYHSIPDSIELARFLIEECKDSGNSNGTFQTGLDMLIRLKKYEEVFTALLEENMLMEALLFVKRYKINIEYISSDASDKLKKLVSENSDLVSDYLRNV